MKLFTFFTFCLFALFGMSCWGNENNKRPQVPITSLASVLTNLKPAVKAFEINPTKENIIKADKGTVIYIPPNIFQFSDGTSPTSLVSFELKECYSLSEMIAENLSTISINQILQTNGMINLKVTADGRELTIKKGKALVIGFPKNNQPDTMDLFYEFTDDKDNKTWVPDYNMFEAEAMLDTKIDSLQNDGDKTPSLNYPIEMTEDLYDYKFSPALMTATFYDLKLKGQDRTIIDYISDPESISDSIAKKFVENNWRVHYKFNIDKNGRIINLKVEDDKEHTNYNAYALNIGIDFLKKAPAFDIENYKDSITNEVLNYAWDYNLGFMGSKQINWDKFKERFREQFAEYKNKAIQKLDKSALDLYLFSATKMGWINCDKFWDTKDEKIDFFVKITDPKNTKVQIVFTDIKSIMNGEMEKDQVIFRNVPVNRKIKVIGISYSNGKPTLSYGLTKTTRSGIELGNFKEFTLNQLEEELNKVN